MNDERTERLRQALGDLIDAVEKVGEGERYWPRDMRLDRTYEAVERALDAGLAALAEDVDRG